MVDLIALTNAQVDAFRRIPELVAAFNGESANIVPYLDCNPEYNSLANAIYTMAPGTILVAWIETLFAEAEIGAWQHTYEYYVRARRQQSPLELIQLLINGIPNPGDGLCWRFCPLMSGVLPTQVTNILRVPDAELIDYFVVHTMIQETGDAL